MGAIFNSLVVLMQATALLSTTPPQKCKTSDSLCLKAAAQAMTPILADGIPALGFEPLDLMHIDDIKLDLIGLKFNMSNVDITGLRNAVIDKVKIDMEKKQLVVVFHVDVVMIGQYKAAGRLLILPISGDGDMRMELKHSETTMIIPFTIVKNKDGKDTIHMKVFETENEVKGGAHYDVTNLFNGNKMLSDSMLKFMNENWKIISQEFGAAVMVKPNKRIFNAIRKYLQSKPLKDIVDV